MILVGKVISILYNHTQLTPQLYKPPMATWKTGRTGKCRTSVNIDSRRLLCVTIVFVTAVKHPALRVFHKCTKSHLFPSWSAPAPASYGETIFFAGSSLLAEEFRLLPEIRLLQGDEQQTIEKQ
ncbi:hypothetical protein OUZ56_026172 [Daphnia magna]|uniref:Uncharacterized protein n=1 Tax=Daphnia magna TaxID=35525 RepID=A0ABQ9ZL22_9CRUS|nr:hypothetical protein OUZ56_026172 [Daphnia magna]